ncbi:unnamed protein product [Orchesella dallaii]|uniref:Uncharacterized protein n=1 Tax=Orchesella dallaii TaxID=48710 RepID=A0ABP1PX77_9HEXA
MAVPRRGNYRLRFYMDLADWEYSPEYSLLWQVRGPITRGRAQRAGLQITEVGNDGLLQYTMYFGNRTREQQARNAADVGELGVRLQDDFAEILEAAGEAAQARIPAYQVEEAGEAARARIPAYQVEEAGEASRARIPAYQVEAAGEAARARALDDQMDDDGQQAEVEQ